MPRQSTAPTASTGSPLIGLTIAVAALYFARDILIPLALALLFAFLLSPVVKAIQSWRVPRVPAVLLVLLVAFGVVGGTGWIVTVQLVEIMKDLPRFRNNIHAKVVAVESPGRFSKLLESFEDLGKEITTTPPSQPRAEPRRPAKSAKEAPPAETSVAPQKVEVVEPPPNALQSLRNLLGPLVTPAGNAGLVVIFTIFMLIDREDLRNRLLGLIGQRQIHLTTKAMDDAAQRVSRYILLQFLVNTAYGVVIAMGLFFLGVPSFLLWGVLATLFRFIPYVGPVAAGALPFLLAVATTEGWRTPASVFLLFLIVELITGNAVEPKVYGAHTGLSAVAILVAAVFWTALWGPVGLILSTPLTVCLSVLGRYSPHLQFLDILLGDTPVLPPDALFYQRLLALDQREALTIIESYLKDRSLVDLYDQVIVPALAMAEQDRHGGQLGTRHEEFIIQSIHEFVTELGDATPKRRPKDRMLVPEEDPKPSARIETRVFCVAAHDAADEITAAMMAHLAEREGFPTLAFPYAESIVELLEGLAPQAGDVICVSSVPPLALTHARTLSQSIREAFPEARLIVGLWGYPAGTSRTIERLQESTGSVVTTTLSDAMQQVRSPVATAVL